MITGPSSGRATSGPKDEGDSPTARVCKSSRGWLRSLFPASGDTHRAEAGTGPHTRAVGDSPQRASRETDGREESSDIVSDFPGLGRAATSSGWPSSTARTARSFLKEEAAHSATARARGGGGQGGGGGHEAHPVPDGVVTYVRMLRGVPLRYFFILLWFVLAASGASIYFPLTRILKISVEPPYGSESEAAKITYAENFPPEPVTLVALLSAVVTPGTNASLINADANMYATLYPPFFGYDPTGSLTAETEAISIDLKRMVQPHLERCEFNFYSFFDMPFEVLYIHSSLS